MKNLEIYCVTNKSIKFLEKTGYKLAAVGKEKFSKNPKKAVAYLKTGEKPINRKTGVINTAALATVISGLMNTAEAISIN